MNPIEHRNVLHPHRFIIDNAGFQLSKFIEVLVHMLLFVWIGNVPTWNYVL